MTTLTVTNRIGYALGDLANTLSFGMTSMFLLAYYTDVLGISAAAAGTLFLVARIWDAVNDPIMGTICDTLVAKKRGEKFRPFLLRGSLPVTAAAILVFWAPEGLSDIHKLVWAYATYIVYGMAYTFINIPYGSLATVMTNVPEERASLSGARAVGGMLGMVSCNIVVPAMLSFFADDLSKAYLYSVISLGIVANISYLLAYRNTAEHIRHATHKRAKPTRLLSTLTKLGRNKPFLCVSITSLLMLTAMLGQGSMLFYYLSLNLNGALWVISATAIVQVSSTLLIAPLIGKMVGKLGSKRVMIFGFIGTSIVAMTSYFLPTGVLGTMIFYCIGMPLMMVPNILIWANVADCIDYNYALSGRRQEGVIYSCYSFMRKLGQAFAGFIAGMGLSIIGYKAGADVQTEETLAGVKAIMFILPAVAMGICALLYKFLWTIDVRPTARVSN